MKDAKVCRVSFHRPNLAFDVRKVAGEADKLRQLGKLIQRLRRPGIVYCATVRAVDELYVALRHGKIPVERYNGKMTTDEREKAQASFMQPGRKVVMLATNAFGLGIDKPDIRYIIHYQMPGSPESYVQEAGRAGRDGKPARCVLLFQPDDIAIQEHFLKEAHPTKSQARMVAEGLYAWSDEGKEVSVRDLALSMALPERRVRVILSVLEAMGVAEEVKAARWKGVEPRPTREQIDKAAMVFEARRISDRRRLSSLLSYMNTQKCRVQMLRSYFGEPEGAQVRPVRFRRGLDSEVFDPGVGRRAARAARGDRLPRAAAATPPGTRRRPRSAACTPAAAPRQRHRRRRCSRPRFRATSAAAAAGVTRFRRRPTASRRSTNGLWASSRRGRGRRDAGRRGRRHGGARHRRGPADSGALAPTRAAETDTAAAPAGRRRLQRPAGRRSATPTFDRTPSGARALRSRSLFSWRARFRAAATRATTPATTATAVAAAAGVAAIATITAAAAGPAADSTAAAVAAAAAAANGSAGAGATATATAATTTGAIITGTAIASAVPGCRAFTIRAATNVAAVARRRLVSPRCPAGTSVRGVARRII